MLVTPVVRPAWARFPTWGTHGNSESCWTVCAAFCAALPQNHKKIVLLAAWFADHDCDARVRQRGVHVIT